MWLQALLTADDFAHVLGQLTPARLTLDRGNPDRYLSLEPPSDVTLVSGEGLRVVTQAMLQWDVIGIRVPLTLRRVSVLLTPRVEKQDEQEVLAFGLRIQEADLSSVPAFIEEPIVARVNEALDRPESRLVWRFMETLDFQFVLPPLLEPQRRAKLFARWGEVRVGDDGVTLAVAWGLHAAPANRLEENVPARDPRASSQNVPPTGTEVVPGERRM
jgi:hypothetical protein